MATYTINSRKYGPLTFFCPDGGGYMRLESAGYPGTLGKQCCKDGSFYGSPILSNPDTLAADAKSWWRSWLRNNTGQPLLIQFMTFKYFP